MNMTDAEGFSELQAHYKDVICAEVRLDCVVLYHVLLANDAALSLSQGPLSHKQCYPVCVPPNGARKR